MGEERRNLRLVLFSLPYQGHITPILHVASVLYSKGFSITICHTQFNSLNPSNHPLFDFELIPDNLSDEEASSRDWLSVTSKLNINCEAPFKSYLARIQEKNPHERILCIISDFNLYFTQAVAIQLKLPRFTLLPLSVSFILSLRDQGYISLQDPSLVPENHYLKEGDKPEINTGNTTTNYVPKLEEIYKAMITSSGIIWNTFDHLEQSQLAQIQGLIRTPLYTIGPLNKLDPTLSSSLLMEDKSCITWLDKQAPKSVIYVSFGSLNLVEKKDLVETAWEIAKSEQPFLWVVRPGSINGSEWIEFLPEGFEEKKRERGCIVKWAPQKDVLAHPAVGGFWTHCGWNSIMESLSEGVPMICRPQIGDQMLNAKYVSDVWKVGLQLENCIDKRGEIERAIKRLMIDKEGAEMRKRAMDMKEKIEVCISKGGSTYESLEHLIGYMLSF